MIFIIGLHNNNDYIYKVIYNFVFEKIPDWINNLVDVKQPRQKRLILLVQLYFMTVKLISKYVKRLVLKYEAN